MGFPTQKKLGLSLCSLFFSVSEGGIGCIGRFTKEATPLFKVHATKYSNEFGI